ncbi:hypothetical protein [Aeromicrobium sp. Leaf272]|uniref:hypothetical protein n=1 Tax=Aeromicrobium sp. Leaf272 TaxID=1736317 RepID=UPI0012E23E42|nr:hypothetical protein [Aeromicrobium sp. Leaf272]
MTGLEQLLFEALDNHRPAASGDCVDASGRAGCPWRPVAGEVAAFTAQHRGHVVRDVIAPLVIEHAGNPTPSPGRGHPMTTDPTALPESLSQEWRR